MSWTNGSEPWNNGLHFFSIVIMVLGAMNQLVLRLFLSIILLFNGMSSYASMTLLKTNHSAVSSTPHADETVATHCDQMQTDVVCEHCKQGFFSCEQGQCSQHLTHYPMLLLGWFFMAAPANKIYQPAFYSIVLSKIPSIIDRPPIV